MPEARSPVVFVLKGYPRLSETFIAQEILGLERKGLSLSLYALRKPTDSKRHPIHNEIKAPVTYLPEYLHQAPLQVLKAWFIVRTYPGYIKAVHLFLDDLRQNFSQATIRRFGQACVLASSLPKDTPLLHAHFLHSPASVVRYAAIIMGIPWSVSAHAKDIWTQSKEEIRAKLQDVSWATTCSKYAFDYLTSLSPKPQTIHLTYHGLDLTRFPKPSPTSHPPSPSLRLLSVGRLVEKKGYRYLLEALASLPHNLPWHFTHVGDGPLQDQLKQQAHELALHTQITWLGPQSQEQVLKAYREADIFILPSIQTDDGDQDGLPNVLMEAQSQGLFCISTRLSGIPELIDRGKTGVLVAQQNAQDLCYAILWAAQHPDERLKMAQAGQIRVRDHFGMDAGINHLYSLFKDYA